MPRHIDSIIAMYFRSNEIDKLKGKNWYSNAYDITVTIGRKYEVNERTVAGVISALSPTNKWTRNIEDAKNMFRHHSYGFSFNDCKVSTFNTQKNKAIEIIENNYSDDVVIKNILNGQKTKSFYSNISTNGKTDDCTVDGHSYNVWNGTATSLRNVPSITEKSYKMIQNDYKEATDIINSIERNNYNTSQIQAITWVAYRRIYKNMI